MDSSSVSVDSLSSVADSLLPSFAPEELLRYYEFYSDEIARMQKEIEALREQGIRSGEDFLNRHPESKVIDKILTRLAEFYYYKAQVEYQRAMEDYERKLSQFDRGEIAELPPEPRKDYRRVLDLYNTIVEKYPQSRYVDDALYNIAFLTEDAGRPAQALETYQRLVEEHPESPYVPEALMRMAEYYFNPPVNDLEKAIEIYKKVLAYDDSPRYDEALYRLGWSYYRLSDYPEAIAYFTILADDINLAKRYDKLQKVSNPALQAESIEYIGISFLDFGGPERAASYIRKIGDRDYGLKILKKIGDVYFDEKEEYEKAVQAYRVLLSLYPNAPEAPQIQDRIVLAYRRLEDEQMASAEREKLFRAYRKGSEWWARNASHREAIRTAEALSRRALTDNLGLLLTKAEETGDPRYYQEYIDQAFIFLDSFAGDTLAPKVHWNIALVLDTKLGRKDEAYQQYIAVSNTYVNSKYQKMAAENAVALAAEAVGPGLDDSLRTVPTELSPEEQRLVEAYDNFIRLFPEDEETALMLANAGALYYNHRLFDGALRYFKTLVRHFPNSPYLAQARLTIMESYFGKTDYKSTEIVAKTIIRSDTVRPEMREKARRRLAESIFLNAEGLAEEGRYEEAASEYVRMVQEVPDAEFTDLALFKAGLQYDQVKRFADAIEVYKRLVEGYPQSKYRLDAMNNLALDYGEEQQYKEAARIYETLAEEHPDSARAQDALYNSSVFYVRAEDWRSAIRVNRRYVDRYPGSEEADDLFFDIASYYLKLGELASANQIYGEYAERFPNSPRVVESYFRRGQYFQSLGEEQAAVAEFTMALRHGEALKQRGLDGNDYFVAEALFAMSEIKWQQYRQISLRLPPEQLRRDKERKTALLKELVSNYRKVAEFGTPRLYQATYRIGQAYEDYADSWAEQEIAETDPTRRAVVMKRIDEEAAKLYERAVEAYLSAATVLQKIADEYAAAHPDTSAATVREGRVAAADSTLQVAERWIGQSKTQATHVVYKIAEVSFQAARRLLTAPVPQHLSSVAELEYWHQLYDRAVAPIVARTLAQHERNLKMARDLGVSGEWVEASKRRLAEVSTLVAAGYKALTDSALCRYQRASDAFGPLLVSADSTGENEGKVYDTVNELGHFLDYATSFAQTSQTQYGNAFLNMSGLEVGSILDRYEEDYFREAFELGMLCDSLARVAQDRQRWATEKQKQSESYLWEDAALSYEDCRYSLADLKEKVLEASYHLADSLGVQSPWVGQIVLALVQSDPERFAGALGLEITSEVIATDANWRASPVRVEDASGAEEFELAVVVDSVLASDGSKLSQIWAPEPLAAASQDSAGGDSSSVPPNAWRFVRDIEIDGLPASGVVRTVASVPYALFVNGECIARVTADSTDGETERAHDISDFLRQGSNRVEFVAVERDDSAPSGLAAAVQVGYVPGWRTERRRLGLAAEDRELERTLYFDKNVIPDWVLSGGSFHAQRIATHE